MSRSTRIVGALPVLALLAAAAVACSTGTAGIGTQSGPLIDSVAPSDSLSAPTTEASTETSIASSTPAPTVKSSATQPSTSATKKSVTPSPTPTAAVKLTSFTVTQPPACGAGTTPVNAVLTWKAQNATELWILSSAASNQAADPRTSGDRLNVNPNGGSVTVSFDCANPEYYYDLAVYNSFGTGTSSKIELKVMKS